MKAGELFKVAGDVAFVTGAASGLGLAFAEVMAANGAHVVMTDIDPARLDFHARRLSDAGQSVEPMIVDVADLERLADAIDKTAAKHRRLDAVFANAGISAGPGPSVPAGELANIDRAAWDRVLRINLTSVMVSVQAAAKPMKAQKRGRIVVTASIGGLRSEPLVGYAYAATKAAIVNLVRHAAVELAPHGVVVNAIAPGPFVTNIGNGRLNDPAVRKAFADMTPMGRLADPQEIMGLALLLASPAASYITGAAIAIDGGITAA